MVLPGRWGVEKSGWWSEGWAQGEGAQGCGNHRPTCGGSSSKCRRTPASCSSLCRKAGGWCTSTGGAWLGSRTASSQYSSLGSAGSALVLATPGLEPFLDTVFCSRGTGWGAQPAELPVMPLVAILDHHVHLGGSGQALSSDPQQLTCLWGPATPGLDDSSRLQTQPTPNFTTAHAHPALPDRKSVV